MQDAATNVAALVGGKGTTKERFDMELSLNLQVEEFVKRGTNLQAYPEVQKLVNDFTAYKKAAIAKVKKLNLAVYVQSMDRTWGIGGVSKEDIAKLTSWIKDVEKVRSITPCFFNEDAKFSQYLALLKRMEYTVPAADAALKRFSF
jgi:hypothetical protein